MLLTDGADGVAPLAKMPLQKEVSSKMAARSGGERVVEPSRGCLFERASSSRDGAGRRKEKRFGPSAGGSENDSSGLSGSSERRLQGARKHQSSSRSKFLHHGYSSCDEARGFTAPQTNELLRQLPQPRANARATRREHVVCKDSLGNLAVARRLPHTLLARKRMRQDVSKRRPEGCTPNTPETLPRNLRQQVKGPLRQLSQACANAHATRAATATRVSM